MMSAFLARGKGLQPTFASNPEQIAKEAKVAKKKLAFEFFTQRLGLPPKAPNGRPSAEYLAKASTRENLVKQFMTETESRTTTVQAWYEDSILPDLPPPVSITPANLVANETKQYFSKDPAVQKLYDDMWHVWAADGSHAGFKTINQWITDVKTAYNIAVPHSTAGDYRKKYMTLYDECKSNKWESNGPTALKMKRQALRIRPNLIETVVTAAKERIQRKAEMELPSDRMKLGPDATSELIALCVEHKDYPGFGVEVVAAFANQVHQKHYPFEPAWTPSSTYAYWFLLAQADFVNRRVTGSKATVAQVVEQERLFGLLLDELAILIHNGMPLSHL
ncbi:hypothetical protein HDU79_000575, partial [Rhizoclosmatium sp. JEL0117]